MSSVNSEVLIIYSGSQPYLDQSTYPQVAISESMQLLDSNYFHVLVVPVSAWTRPDFTKKLNSYLIRNITTQIVLSDSEKARPDDVLKITQQYSICRICDKKDLEPQLVFALEKARLKQQNLDLERLVKNQNEKLKNLYDELEARVEKRQGFLLESKKKLFLAQTRWESLRQATMTVYAARSKAEIESNLRSVLSSTLRVDRIRIFYKPHDQVFADQNLARTESRTLQSPLFNGSEAIGSVFFIRDSTDSFSRDETEFAIRISEAISLALRRLQAHEHSAWLKEQWQATFNAISDPVALISTNFEVALSNRAFKTLSGAREGQKCYQQLFQRESPCPQCRFGQTFKIEHVKKGSRLLEVKSERVEFDEHYSDLFFHAYKDITEKQQMEKKILESARLAELGTIGSSIAHELNNPLGGMLSFTQLLKMDSGPNHSDWEDLNALEDGVRRCKEIVENLLSFTRTPTADSEADLDLKDVLLRALKIVELQTKSRGIEVKMLWPPQPLIFKGHMNLLSQAFRNMIQASIDALIFKMNESKTFKPVLEIRLSLSESHFEITLLDNGASGDPLPSLNLAVATQIIRDYGGEIEVQGPAQRMRLAKISLPRPVFQA
jgi:C4-dicarboxylate-specific signal transduction histidine kinase